MFKEDALKFNKKKNQKEKVSSNDNEQEKVFAEEELCAEINKSIGVALDSYSNKEKSRENFDLLIKELRSLKYAGGENSKYDENVEYNADRAWSQEQVAQVIDIYEELGEQQGLPDDDFLRSIFSTYTKNNAENDTVSDLTAKVLTERINKGEILSNNLQKQIEYWCQNMQMVDKNIRIDFLVAILNNPGKIHSSTKQGIIQGLGLFANSVKSLEDYLKNKSGDNIVKELNVVTVLDYLVHDRNAGFEDSSQESQRILNDIGKENKSYFVQVKVEQVLAGTQNETSFRDESLNLYQKYNEPDLRQNYDITPKSAKNEYGKSEIIMVSPYSGLNNNYGIIYTPEGKMDSFFELKPALGEQAIKDISMQEILAKEGFKKESMSEDDYSKMIATYQALLELPLRNKIENEFDINIKDFSIREQVQFINFLSSKTVEEVDEVKLFLNQAQDEQSKLNRIKSFLSLEVGQEVGDKILDIGSSVSINNEQKDQIFEKTAGLADMVNKEINELKEVFYLTNSSVDLAEVHLLLLAEMGKIIGEFSNTLNRGEAESKERVNELLVNLEKVNPKILLISGLIKQLTRDEVSQIDLTKIADIERLEDIDGVNIIENQEILNKIKTIIREQFPKGDDEFFEEECRENNNLRLTATIANSEVLSFFSKERVTESVDYIDWFISNPKAPIKGLGEATLKLGFKEIDDNNLNYAVAKPHAKSFYLFVEKLGFVAFEGTTLDGEYKHHYTRIRKVETDDSFMSKNIPEEQTETFNSSIQNICQENNQAYPLIFEGKRLAVCRVEYHGQTHEDDIAKSDKDGWIMTEIDRQAQVGNVLTRFIPETSKKENQAYYIVFEEDNAQVSSKVEIEKAVNYKLEEANLHSDSKKALNN